jgi:hypothetical protein
VKKSISKKLAKRKRKINKRVKKIQWPSQPQPMMAGRNIVYDFDGRHQGIAYGGIGNIHQLAARSGLIDEIDNRIELLKRHVPYHGYILQRYFFYITNDRKRSTAQMIQFYRDRSDHENDIEQLKNGVNALTR